MTRILTSAVLAVLVLGCDSKSSSKTEEKAEPKSETKAEPKSEPKPEPAKAAASGCEAALANTYKVIDASGVASLKEAVAQQPLDASIAQCKSEAWSDELTSCLATATSVDVIYGDCYAKPLRTQPLTIVRTIPLQDQQVDPPLFTVSGDYLEISDGCGVLFMKVTPSEALFLMCDGQTRGPINTPDQIAALFEALAQRSEQAHQTTMSILNNMPSGRFGGWKVCDQAGNCRIE